MLLWLNSRLLVGVTAATAPLIILWVMSICFNRRCPYRKISMDYSSWYRAPWNHAGNPGSSPEYRKMWRHFQSNAIKMNKWLDIVILIESNAITIFTELCCDWSILRLLVLRCWFPLKIVWLRHRVHWLAKLYDLLPSTLTNFIFQLPLTPTITA